METEIIKRNTEFENLNREIKIAIKISAKDMVQLGYMLRRMMEQKLYLAYYDCFDDYLSKELHMDYTAATRFIKCNKKYSIAGNSMDLAPEYADYSRSLLVEMLNMPPELEVKVTPDMTVKQAREIKRQEKQKSEAVRPDPEEENVTDAEFREIPAEPEKVATSQPGEEDKPHDKDWFIRQYVEILPREAERLLEICRKEQNNSDRAKAIQQHIAPYGCHCISCAEYDFSFHGFAGGLDFRIGKEEQHLKYGALVNGLMKILEERESTEEKSAYGLSQSVYPENSLIAIEGCGNKHTCFSCAQDCGIRKEERYCRLAPLGNPFSCTTMGAIEILKAEMGDRCQFVNNDLADHTAGSSEADPCCGNCKEESCGYRCQKASNPVMEEKELLEPEPEAPATNRLRTVKEILQKEQKLLNDYIEVGGMPEKTVERQKIIVGALASMVSDLENNPVPDPQPELPVLKNNDQRKEWLAAYKEWGFWYRDENLDVNYYKYDFQDGSRLVVAEYPQRHSYYSSEYRDEHYYHLLEKNKKGYGKPYDEKFRHQTDSESYLVEFLKNLQKK